MPTECHVRVRFDGYPQLDYMAETAAAIRFALAAVTVGAVVTTDDNLRDDLRPLPCARLWRFP